MNRQVRLNPAMGFEPGEIIRQLPGCLAVRLWFHSRHFTESRGQRPTRTGGNLRTEGHPCQIGRDCGPTWTSGHKLSRPAKHCLKEAPGVAQHEELVVLSWGVWRKLQNCGNRLGIQWRLPDRRRIAARAGGPGRSHCRSRPSPRSAIPRRNRDGSWQVSPGELQAAGHPEADSVQIGGIRHSKQNSWGCPAQGHWLGCHEDTR